MRVSYYINLYFIYIRIIKIKIKNNKKIINSLITC